MRLSMGMGLYDLLRRAAAGVAQSTLLQDLISYWPLNEVSGVRYDAVGTNHLTDNNTVGAVLRGPEGTVARVRYADNEDLEVAYVGPTTYTFAGWVRADTLDQFGLVFSMKEGVLGQVMTTGNYTGYVGQAVIAFAMYDGTAWVQTNAWMPGFASPAGWVFLVATCDNTAKEIKAYLNNVQAGTTASFTGTPGNFSTNDKLKIGSYQVGFNTLGITANFAPDNSRFALWDRVLTSDERLALFASGNGLRYADLDASLLTGLVSWWELDEVSGVRRDSHGTNHLTDNNTVGASISGPRGVVATFNEGNINDNEVLYFENPVIDMSLGATFAGWYHTRSDGYGTTTGYSRNFFGMGKPTWAGSTGGFGFGNGNTGPFAMYFGVHDGSTYANNYSGNALLEGWNYLVGRYDPIDKRPVLWVNNQAVPYYSGGPLTRHPVIDGQYADFNGQQGGYYLASSGGASRQANAGLWNRYLTDEECAALWNDAQGKRYDELTAGEKVGLLHFWDMDETSGARADKHGNKPLSDYNSVRGIVNAGGAMDGAAASFVRANNEALIGPAFPADATLTVSMWFNFATLEGTYQTLIDANGGGNFMLRGGPEYGTGFMYMAIRGFADTLSPAVGLFNCGLGWHHVVCWHDADANEIGFCIDNTTVFTQATGGQNNAITNLMFGLRGDYPDGLNGVIDEPAVWSRVLTADERAELFNLGRGRFYAFT